MPPPGMRFDYCDVAMSRTPEHGAGAGDFGGGHRLGVSVIVR